MELMQRLRSGLASDNEPLPAQPIAADPSDRIDSSVCAHLGLEQNPFAHHDEPSSDHRCYLWMQRDRIDRAHQSMFCLTSESASCPWLSISNPKQAPQPFHRRAAQAVAERLPARLDELDSSWQRALLRALVATTAAAERSWQFLEPILLQLGLWLLVGLRTLGPILLRPLVALSKAYGRQQRRAIGALTAKLAATLQFKSSTQPVPTIVADPTEETLASETLLERAVGTSPGWQPVAAGPVSASVPLPEHVVAADEPPVDAEAAAAEYLRRGMEAIREGDAEGALRRFRLATSADAQNEQAWLLRGAVAGSDDEKADCFRKALALNPNSARARVGLAQLGITSVKPEQTGRQAKAFATLYQAEPAGHVPTSEPWPCPHCRMMNEGDITTCGRCGRPSPKLERELGHGGDLLKKGLHALQVGSEELAYEYFSAAAKAEPENEQAWYWQAKTAPTLDELIHCLEHIVAVNPNNVKVQVDLQWALQRRDLELEQQVQATRPKTRAVKPEVKSRLAASIREGLLQLAAAAAFVSALVFTLPSVISLTDWATVPEFRPVLDLLPTFTMPSIPIQTGFVAAFDLGPTLPLIIGVLLLQAAFSLGDGAGRAMRYWSSLLGSVAIILLTFYASPTALVGAVAAIVVIVLAPAGQAAQGDRGTVK